MMNGHMNPMHSSYAYPSPPWDDSDRSVYTYEADLSKSSKQKESVTKKTKKPKRKSFKDDRIGKSHRPDKKSTNLSHSSRTSSSSKYSSSCGISSNIAKVCEHKSSDIGQSSSKKSSTSSRDISHAKKKETRSSKRKEITYKTQNLNVPNISSINNRLCEEVQHEKKKKKVWCMLCHYLIFDKQLKNHLFFGPLKCDDCGWDCTTCDAFFKTKANSADLFQNNCQHSNLQWRKNLVTHMKHYFSFSDSSDERFQKKMRKYLRILSPLSSQSPWKGAFEICQDFLNLKLNLKKERIETPASDFYLIYDDPMKNAPNECPNCYTWLDPANLYINPVSYFLDILCTNCDLKIFLIFKDSEYAVVET